MMKLKKKSIKKKAQKWSKSTWINLLNIIIGSLGQTHIIASKQNKSWGLILNQLNIK